MREVRRTVGAEAVDKEFVQTLTDRTSKSELSHGGTAAREKKTGDWGVDQRDRQPRTLRLKYHHNRLEAHLRMRSGESALHRA